MRKRNILGVILFVLSIIISIILVISFNNNNDRFLYFETIQDTNDNKFNIKNEFDFNILDDEFLGELISKNGKLYLQEKNDDYKVRDKYEILLKDGEAKKIKCDNLNDESIEEEIEQSGYVDGYKYEALEDKKGKLFDLYSNEEFLVDLDKFNKDNIAEKTYGEYCDSKIVENKIFFFIRRDPGRIKLFSDDDSRYKEIRWYDFNEEIWDSIKLSKKHHVESIIGSVDNKIYLTGNEEWGSQYPSKIYSIDLNKKKINEEKRLQNIGEYYYDRYNLNEENILLQIGTENGEEVRVLNLRENKIFNIFTNKYPDKLWLSNMVSPKHDKIFYVLDNEDKLEVKVVSLKDGKVGDTVTVYSEFTIENMPIINWSEDGEYLILAEKKSGKIFNIKILNFKF